MKTTRALYIGMVTLGIAVFLAASMARMSAQQVTGEAARIVNDDLGGVVTSAKGPEAVLSNNAAYANLFRTF